MRPIKLEIEGLNSFESKQVLDFDKLGEGVFGIFGKTGSGKSTILDSITLALYGSTNRTKLNVDFINTKCKKAVVTLEFELVISSKTSRYKVSRTFNSKKSGVDSSAMLYKLSGDEAELIAEGTTKVNDKIFKLIGLGVDEFSKCIALPQGEFAAFLEANPSKRTEIMSNIFDLTKYGEKLAQSVKSKLAEADKEVATINASREYVSYATKQMVRDAEAKLNKNSNDYNALNASFEEKSARLKTISNIIENKHKLDEVESKFAKLSSELESIEALKLIVVKNQNANQIKTDYDKLKTDTDDEKELSDKIAILNEGKLCAESEFAVAKQELEDFKIDYTSKLFDLNSKLARLNELNSLADELNQHTLEKEKLDKKIEDKKKECSLAGENQTYISASLEKLEEELSDIDDFIDANKPDVDLSYALEQTKGIESELYLIDDFYKKLEYLVDETNKDLASVQEEYNSAIADEKVFAAKRDKIQKTIEVAFEDSDSTNFSKLRSCDKELVSMIKVEEAVNAVNSQIDKIHDDTNRKLTTVAVLVEQIDEIQQKLSVAEADIVKKEKDLSISRDTREELLGNNVISFISGNLQIGDFCPVCNNRVMQRIYGETLDLSAAEGEINRESQELKGLRFERDKIFADLVSLKSKYQFEKELIEINKAEIESLTNSRDNLYQKFVDKNDNSKENFEKLKGLLVKTADSLEELIVLQNEIRDAEQRVLLNKVQAGTKITLYKNYLESLLDMIYDLQKKKAEREFAILNINEKYDSLKEFKKQIAEGKNIELIIDGKREEKIKLRERKAELIKEKEVAANKLHELSIELEVLKTKLTNEEKQLNIVRAKITTSGVPEGASIESEKQETDKAIAKLKYDFENVQSKFDAAQENLNRLENEYNVKSSIIKEKRMEINSLERKINENMMAGGFKEKAELENYFVSASELKERQEKISNFESEYKIVSLKRDELLSEVTEEVDESKLKELETETLVLSERIKKLSENVGEARAEYERIKKDYSKNVSLESELAAACNRYDLLKELSTLLKGKALAEYIAEEYLTSITEAASQKLAILLGGKYTLKFKNKEFVVEDNFSDGEERPASTLSGGETFLVSLALALSISESITQLSNRSMDFFFLDEGFGTLDSELCNTVISALYKLESQNFRIGLISHVGELADQIKNKVIVTKTSNGSKIKIENTL